MICFMIEEDLWRMDRGGREKRDQIGGYRNHPNGK